MYSKYEIWYYTPGSVHPQQVASWDTLIQADNDYKTIVKNGGYKQRLRIVLCCYDKDNRCYYQHTLPAYIPA